jgi:hypothetical protein
MRATLPRDVPREFTIKVRFNMKTVGFEEAAARLESAVNQTAVASLLRAVVIRTLVRQIRRRFLANVEKSLEMQVLSQNGQETLYSPRKRMTDLALKDKLDAALERLNEAQISGDLEAVEGASKRAQAMADALRKRLGGTQDRRGEQKPGKGSHYLSNMAGNQFRKRLMALLSLMTEASFVAQVPTDDGGALIGVGLMSYLDQLETPSATQAFTGRPSTSRYRSFWRHVEFGTGIRRSKAKDGANPGVGPMKTWYYSPRPKFGLLLAGTQPMNALTTAEGGMYTEDTDMLRTAVVEMLDQLLTSDAR